MDNLHLVAVANRTNQLVDDRLHLLRLFIKVKPLCPKASPPAFPADSGPHTRKQGTSSLFDEKPLLTKLCYFILAFEGSLLHAMLSFLSSRLRLNP